MFNFIRKAFSLIIFFCGLSTSSGFLLAQSVNQNGNRKTVTSVIFDTIPVNIDGHNIFMYGSGNGKFTVVLEAGGASNHKCWSSIDTSIAKMTRVISYDRPGYLKSAVCEKPRDAITVATELNKALETAGYPPPYIMVGWSLGGAFVRAFCGLYPEKVAGLILVDPTPEDFYARVDKEFPELLAYDSLYVKKVLASTDRPGDRAEIIAFDSSMNQARVSDASHSTPTTLLIASYGKIPGEGDMDPENPINRIWKEEHIKWAAKRPNLQYKIISCGHHIAKQHPEMVMQAISDMIKRVNK